MYIKISILTLVVLLTTQVFGQTYKISYIRSFNDQVRENQDTIVVFTNDRQTTITSERILRSAAAQPFEELYIDRMQEDLLYRKSTLNGTDYIATSDSSILESYAFELKDEYKTIQGYRCRKAVTSVNSNTIELWYTNDLNVKGAPSEIGQKLGLVLEMVRNGQMRTFASHIQKISKLPSAAMLPVFEEVLNKIDYQDRLWKSRFIQISIFKDEVINFGEHQASDGVLRFANGTVIMKKIRVPEINNASQAFIELVEKSNGDAYDRTGSVFLIAEDMPVTFLDGMKNGMETIPYYMDEAGKKYPGMIRTDEFSPVFELMRFFTPFGVSHFNDRLQLKGKTWQDSVSYRQDISEFIGVLSGKEVYIGTYIGNYDKGGHRVSLEMTVHQGESNYAARQKVLPIFNTTNVMEMGGQTYATFFAHEKGLEFSFELKEDAKNVRLRYITTGHGGWGNGDEFVPKPNSIYWNGELVFRFTPWRVDCGSYRLYNPVSGNFGNGLSSSDLSRSNWCPGTITYPDYIDLGDLPAGTHTVRVHIPQGAPEGESFSFWNVSGALLYQ